MEEPVKVVVTGAAGPTAYSLLYSVASGAVFGGGQPMALVLMDVPSMLGVLSGVAMELQDCALQLLQGVTVTDLDEVAFRDVDVAVLIAEMPSLGGAETDGQFRANVRMVSSQGKALDAHAKKTVKVVVVGGSANTGCLVAMTAAPSIPRENFSCLTSPGRSQARAQTFPQRATTLMGAGRPPGAMSTANAIGDHLRALWSGTQKGEYVSMGVLSKGNPYGVPDQLIYPFPVTVQERRWKMVHGLSMSEASRRRMAQSARELLEERERALRALAKSNL